MLAAERGIDLLERLQHALEIGFGDTHPGVGDGDRQTVYRIETAADVDAAAGGGEFHRVGDQVQEDLLGLAFVAADRRQVFGEIDGLHQPGGVDAPGGQLADRAHDVANVEHVFAQVD